MEQDKAFLGKEPIGKLLLRYSLPAIAAMVVFSLYNIIDSIFIGHGVGPLAISGLAITFPVMNLTFALVLLVGIGGAFMAQIFVNVGMNLRLLPVIGVTLPFYSAGGSSVLMLYICVGLVLSVYMHNTKKLFG